MISSKTLRDWFLVFMALLIFPEENRVAVLDVTPSDLYGEIVLAGQEESYILAKNTSPKAVTLDLDGPTSLVTLQSGQAHAYFNASAGAVMPHSLAIIKTAVNMQTLDRQPLLGGERYFTPGRLSVMTGADWYYAYLAGGIIFGGAILLGFLIARLGVGNEPWPTNESG